MERNTVNGTIGQNQNKPAARCEGAGRARPRGCGSDRQGVLECGGGARCAIEAVAQASARSPGSKGGSAYNLERVSGRRGTDDDRTARGHMVRSGMRLHRPHRVLFSRRRNRGRRRMMAVGLHTGLLWCERLGQVCRGGGQARSTSVHSSEHTHHSARSSSNGTRLRRRYPLVPLHRGFDRLKSKHVRAPGSHLHRPNRSKSLCRGTSCSAARTEASSFEAAVGQRSKFSWPN